MEQRTVQSIGLFLLGTIVFSYGVVAYLRPSTANVTKSSLTERDLAIDQALKQDSKTYQFESSFLPGIGPSGR